MIFPSLSKVNEFINILWPYNLSEEWDKTGLVYGPNKHKVIKKILFTIDTTRKVVEEAIKLKIDLLISHHPMFMKDKLNLKSSNAKTQSIISLIKSNCYLLTVHTNADKAEKGVSDVFARKLNIKNIQPLCCSKKDLNINSNTGIGRIGYLSKEITLEDLENKIKEIFLNKMFNKYALNIKVSGIKNGKVKKIALCCGSGSDLMKYAINHASDVFITSDVKHHDASDFCESRSSSGKPYLIDVSHYISEALWLPKAAKLLKNIMNNKGYDSHIEVSKVNTDPWIEY